MDASRFDQLARSVGKQTNRRNMVKVAAGSTLAVLGVAAGERSALAAGFQGDACVDSGDCRRGLRCDTTLTNPRCAYRRNCGGKNRDACKTDGQCCNNRNLVCENRKCRRNRRNR